MGCAASATVIQHRPPLNCAVQKEGYILYSASGGNWKTYLFNLYQDSTFIWYGSGGEELGSVKLKDIAPLIAIGQNCLNVPKRPEIPADQSINRMMAYPFNYSRGTHRKDMKINWILYRGDDEMQQWMQALGAVLPPPPQPQQNGQAVQGQAPPQVQAPPPGLQLHVVNGHVQNGYSPAQPMYNPQPNGYPAQSYGYPAQPYGYPAHPQQQSGYKTVVVQQHHHVPQQHTSSGHGFATGLLMGGALGLGMGNGWGHFGGGCGGSGCGGGGGGCGGCGGGCGGCGG